MDIDTQAGAQLQRSPDVWFDDGNVIIQAGSTLFRIYKGILQARSTVFNDMFSFPQPSDQELMEGCPVVLFHDAAPDMTVFLKAIYDSGFFERPSQTSFSVVAGILRLATKYDVAYLRQRVISQLVEIYPPTLEKWDQRSNIPPLISDAATSHFALVNLARETDVPSVLPAALYCCSMHGAEDIIDGIVQPDGSRSELSPADMRACLLARETFARHPPMLAFMADLGFIEGLIESLCEDPNTCVKDEISILRSCALAERSFDLLDGRVLTKDASFVHTLCDECAGAIKYDFERQRLSIWERLPALYGLPPWETLLQGA
ncbi:hypothetical protein PLICRDRAFT_700275 [Plicaturopsis crispa FD-325 SS-3]|nr:hypothetical protein PLICRDRAFT_700275 [Plicaturopsis crispa FD-325 SS-3]